MSVCDAKRILLDWAQNYFESGHGYIEDYEEFKQCCRDEGIRPSKTLYSEYLELIELGPCGFYESYKDELDFDPFFIQEYGEEDEENEDYE